MSTPDPDALDRADMGRLAAGEDRALNDLMDRHAATLYGFLVRFVGDPEAAEDLAQETFVRVYRHRAEYRPAHRFSTWLFTIGANLARNHLRSRTRRPEVPLDPPLESGEPRPADRLTDGAPDPAQQAATSERSHAVRQAVADLPDDLREAVVLCELDDHPVAEAARILATTPKAVESRLYRARGRLRQVLGRWLSA